MIRWMVLSLLALALGGIAASGPAPAVAPAVAPDLPPVPEADLPFPVGETLTYTIYWGWIAVGESVATTAWIWKEEEGRWLLNIRFRTKSNAVLSAVYPVDDVVETLIDPETLRPLVFHMNLKEGRHRRNETTRFDWDRLVAHYHKKRKDKPDEKKTYPIKENTRDLVSFMYFLRKTPFEPDTTYKFEVMSDEKLYDLTVRSRDYDKILLDEYGRVKSLRLDPEASFEGVFVRKGEMRLWLSAGGRRILTKLFVDTPFANVRLLLKSVSGPGAESWMEEE